MMMMMMMGGSGRAGADAGGDGDRDSKVTNKEARTTSRGNNSHSILKTKSPQNWWEFLGICCLSRWSMFRVKILRASVDFCLWRNLLPWAMQDTTTATCQDLSEQLTSTSGRRTKQEITLPLSDVNLRTGKATDLAGFLSLSETQTVLKLLLVGMLLVLVASADMGVAVAATRGIFLGWWSLLLPLLLLLQGLVDDLKVQKSKVPKIQTEDSWDPMQIRRQKERLGKIEEVQSQD